MTERWVRFENGCDNAGVVLGPAILDAALVVGLETRLGDDETFVLVSQAHCEFYGKESIDFVAEALSIGVKP